MCTSRARCIPRLPLSLTNTSCPRGNATSLAIQEVLESRGAVIPGVARVLPPPMAVLPHEISCRENDDDTTGHARGGPS